MLFLIEISKNNRHTMHLNGKGGHSWFVNAVKTIKKAWRKLHCALSLKFYFVFLDVTAFTGIDEHALMSFQWRWRAMTMEHLKFELWSHFYSHFWKLWNVCDAIWKPEESEITCNKYVRLMHHDVRSSSRPLRHISFAVDVCIPDGVLLTAAVMACI